MGHRLSPVLRGRGGAPPVVEEQHATTWRGDAHYGTTNARDCTRWQRLVGVHAMALHIVGCARYVIVHAAWCLCIGTRGLQPGTGIAPRDAASYLRPGMRHDMLRSLTPLLLLVSTRHKLLVWALRVESVPALTDTGCGSPLSEVRRAWLRGGREGEKEEER